MNFYPLPTQPPLRDAPEPVLRLPEDVPYPAPTTGLAIPARIASIGLIKLEPGLIFQLEPILLDCAGNEQKPTGRFTYRSNNPRVLVSDAGLISTNCPPQLVSRRGSGQSAKVTIAYGSTATITTIVEVFVSADFDHVVSD
jgi:hypothetical protein